VPSVIGGGILTLAVVGVTAWLVPSLRSLDIERATPEPDPGGQLSEIVPGVDRAS